MYNNIVKDYENKVDNMEKMFYTFMFNSDPQKIVKVKPGEGGGGGEEDDDDEMTGKRKVTIEKTNMVKQITKAAVLELCGRTLQRTDLIDLLGERFPRRKVHEVVTILESLKMVCVLYKSGDERTPTGEDIFSANKNMIITATSLQPLEDALCYIKEINKNLEAILTDLLKE